MCPIDMWRTPCVYLTSATRIFQDNYVNTMVNSLAPGRPGCHFKTAIFNLVLLIGFFRSSNDNAPRWMSWDLTDDKSTLVQVMAWCRQATSHYLSQCWPSSMSPYGVTRPQWVNDALAPCIRRSSTTIMLNIEDQHVLAFHKVKFQLSVPSQFREIIQKCIYICVYIYTYIYNFLR